MRETGSLGLIIAISDAMQLEGWGKRDAGERIVELRRRVAKAQGKLHESTEGEIITTVDGQVVMLLR